MSGHHQILTVYQALDLRLGQPTWMVIRSVGVMNMNNSRCFIIVNINGHRMVVGKKIVY